MQARRTQHDGFSMSFQVWEAERIRDILRRWACTLHWLWRRCCPAWAPAWSHRCRWRCTWPGGMRMGRTNNRHQIRSLTEWLTDRQSECVSGQPGGGWKIQVRLFFFYPRQRAGDERLGGCFCRSPNAVIVRWRPKQCSGKHICQMALSLPRKDIF